MKNFETLNARVAERLREMGVDPDGTIAVEDAGLVWNFNQNAPSLTDLKQVAEHVTEGELDAAETTLVKFKTMADDLRVIDFAKIRDQTATPKEHALWMSGRCTSGACMSEWMADPAWTPEQQFIDFIANGEISPDAIIHVLREFSKIKECNWARIMLAGAPRPDM